MQTYTYKIIDCNNDRVLDTVEAFSEYLAVRRYTDVNGYRVNLRAEKV